MKGVKFGDIHTSEFGIYLSSVSIGEATVKEHRLDIPGANGTLDLTDFFGSIAYENRKITLKFTFPQHNDELLSVYSSFQQAVHGKHFDSIILDDDSEHHYVGRVSVGTLKKGVISAVTVECECEPYKYRNTANIIEITVDDVEFPTGWLYGDVTGNKIVNVNDLNEMSRLIGKRTYESERALRADFDFDGVVTETDRNALDSYISSGSQMTFEDYIITNMDSSLIEMKNCKRVTIDFGDAPVKVTFSVKEITNTRLWELRVDNIPEFTFHGYEEYSTYLSGTHEIMIATANINTTGVFEVKWDSAGLF